MEVTNSIPGFFVGKKDDSLAWKMSVLFLLQKNIYMCHGQKSLYWVDDHPLLYGNNGSFDPGTYNKTFSEKKHQLALLYTSAHNMISSTKGRLLRSDEHLQVLEEIQLRMDNGGQLVTFGSPPLVWDE